MSLKSCLWSWVVAPGKGRPVFSLISSSYTYVRQTDNGRDNLDAASRGRVVGKGRLAGLVSPVDTPIPVHVHISERSNLGRKGDICLGSLCYILYLGTADHSELISKLCPRTSANHRVA